MRTLKNHELIKISGGFDGVSAFCILSALNIAIGLYNTFQIQQAQEMFTDVNGWLDYFYTKALYSEAQLISLPGYKETNNLSFDEANSLVTQQYQ